MGQEPESTPAEGQEPEATPANEAPEAQGNKPESFSREYVESLRAEAARHRTRAQELEDANKSELERAQTKAQRAEQAKADAEARLLRYEVAAEKDVPADALDFLTGNTREELEAKADKLLELVKSRNEQNREPDFDGGAREPAEENLTPEEEHNRLFLQAMGLTPNT